MEDVVYYKENILHIHSKTMNIDLSLFTICIDNFSFPFMIVHVFISLEGSIYKSFIKDIRNDIYRKL